VARAEETAGGSARRTRLMSDVQHADRRELAESVKELAGVAFTFHLTIAVVWVWLSAAAKTSFDQSFALAAEAGKFILEPAFGFFGTVLALLLGLFAVSAGGQVLGPLSSIADMRRRLGWAGEILAAAALVSFTFIALYCLSDPPSWASILILGPEMGAIIFLALQLAGFIVWEPQLRRNLLIDRIDRLERARARLPNLASHAWASIWLANTLLVTVAALVPPLLVGATVPRLVVCAIVGLVMSLVANGFGIAAMLNEFTSTDRPTRWLMRLTTLGGYGFVAASCALLALSAGWSVASTAALATLLPLASMFIHAHRFFSGWTLRGAAARLADRSLAKKLAVSKGALEGLELPPEGAFDLPSPGQRLRTILDQLFRARTVAEPVTEVAKTGPSGLSR